MNDVIPISSHTIGAAAVPTVNLRELHGKLGSKMRFVDWAKVRLEEAMAENGSDYLLHQEMKQINPGQRGGGAKHMVNYYATLDTAKHIAMLERNEKGREIRAYFIEAEKTLRKAAPLQKMGPVELARLHLAAALRLEASGKALDMLVPVNTYGAIAPNGKARIGLRRASFVANRHRKAAAEEFMDTMERIDEMERQLELGLEETAA